MKIKTMLAIAATIAAVSVGASAVPITYVLNGTMSGSLNGTNFSSAAFTMVGYSDTSTRTFFLPGVPYTTLSAYAVTIAGFSTVFGTDTMTMFDNQLSMAAGFADVTQHSDVLDFSNGAFASYGVITAIGPLPVSVSYTNHAPTTGGDLVIASAGSLSFQVVGGVTVPEPGTLALLAAGLLGLGWVARRRSQQV